MVYSDPKVRFTFSDGTTITANNVVKDSIAIRQQSLSGLDSSSDTVYLELAPLPMYDSDHNITLNGMIMSQNSDIKAEILDGETLLYTGYVSNNRAWSLSQRGSDNLKINLESVGVRRFKVPCTERLRVYSGKVSEVVGYVAGIAMVDVSENAEVIDKEVYVRLDPKVTCDNLLNDILKEYGYYYFFESDGKLNYARTNLVGGSPVNKTLWATDDDTRFKEGDGLLRVESGSAVKIKRKIADYKQAQVCFSTVEHRNGVSVYALEDELIVPSQYWWDGVLHRREDLPSIISNRPEGIDHFPLYSADSGKVNIETFGISGWGESVKMINLLVECKFETDSALVVEGGFGHKPGIEFSLWSNGSRLDSHLVTCRSVVSKFFSDSVTAEFNLTTKDGVIPDSIVAENVSYKINASVSQIRLRFATGADDAIASTTTAVDLESGKDIWYMDNVVADGFTETSNAYVRQPYEGDIVLEVLVDNTSGFSDARYGTFAARADVVTTVSDENYVYASKDGVLSAPTIDTTYTYKTNYVTDIESARRLAETFAKYYIYCQIQYTFSSTDDIAMGAIVNVKDNLFSGLNAKVCVTGKSFVIKSGRETLYTYSGYAISDISEVATRSSINSHARPVYNYTPFQEYIWSISDTDWAKQGKIFKFGNKHILLSGVIFGDLPAQDWMTTVEENHPEEFLWSRINGGAPFRITGNQGVEGAPGIPGAPGAPGNDGEDGKSFVLKATSMTYDIDLRSSGYNDGITIYWDKFGYEGTPSVSCTTNASWYDNATRTLTIPKNTVFRSVTIVAELEGASTQTIVLTGIDTTEYNKYFGTSVSGQTVIEGDCYFNGSTSLIMYLKNGEWVTLSQSGAPAALRSEICAKAQKDALSTIEPGSLTKSDYGYFNDIIAGTVTADYVGSKEIVLKGTTGSIKSSNYVAGKSGFQFKADGSADITGSVQATSFRIGDTKLEYKSGREESITSGAEIYLGDFNDSTSDDSVYEVTVTVFNTNIVNSIYSISFSYVPFSVTKGVDPTVHLMGTGTIPGISSSYNYSYEYGYSQNVYSCMVPYIKFTGRSNLQYAWVTKRWSKVS